MIHNLTPEGSFREILSSNNLVLVDFYADWCEPCKWLDGILHEIEPKMPPNSLIVKVDADAHQALAECYGVRSVPVLVLFKSSVVVWRMNGFLMGQDLLEKVSSFS